MFRFVTPIISITLISEGKCRGNNTFVHEYKLKNAALCKDII